jgi:two-component sensor histidine kinase
MTRPEALLDLLVVDAPAAEHAVYRSALQDIAGEPAFVSQSDAIDAVARERRFAAVFVHLQGAAAFDPERIGCLLERVPGVPVVLVAKDVSESLAVLPRLSERFPALFDALAWPVVPELLRQKVRIFAELARSAATANELAAALENETQRARALAALVGEEVHRGKNLLAIMQSISLRTVGEGRSLADARQVLIGRLRAIARAYDLVTRSGRAGAALLDIVEGELGEAADRVFASGPPVRIKGAMAQTFTLAIHELVTNSLAYGALGSSSGVVAIGWTFFDHGEESYLGVEWREQGGPPPVAPPRHGFGLSLLATLAGAGAPSPNVSFEAPGFVCRLRLPQDTLAVA